MQVTSLNQSYLHHSLPKGAKARLGTGYLTGNIVYSPDGTQLVVHCSTGIWVYNVLTLEAIDLITEYRICNSSIIEYKRQWWQLVETNNAVGFNSDGNLFAIRTEWCGLNSKDIGGKTIDSESYTLKILKIWNREIEDKKEVSIISPEKVNYMELSPDGTTLAGVHNPDGRTSDGVFKNAIIYFWNIDTGKLLNTLTINGKIDCLMFSPDSKSIAVAYSFPTGEFGYSISDETGYEYIHCFIDVWDISTCELKFGLPGDSVFGFSYDGNTLAGRVDGMTVAMLDARTGVCNSSYTYYDSSLGSATSLTFSPNGNTLAGCIDGDKVALWDANTGICKGTFTETGYITSLVFSPDSQNLAGGCEDGTVLIWDVESHKDSSFFNEEVPILTEKKTPYQNRSSQIQRFCEESGIKTLCHFTRIENLNSILQEGLIGRSHLEERGQKNFNDPKRWDRHKEAICLSISFPNYSLFNKFSRLDENSPADYSKWVVLLLKVNVLWELDCAFQQENASSNTIRHDSLEEKKKPEALEDLFVNSYCDTKGNVYKRVSQEIPSHYPTHPQAEVLVFDQIRIEYIKEVHFFEKSALKQWQASNSGDYSPQFLFNNLYFRYPNDRIN